MTAARIRISCSTSPPIARPDPGRRRQFRLRLLARACALGIDGFRHSLRDLDLVRRYLLQQLLQERHASDPGLRGGSGEAVRRRRARRQRDAVHRSGEAGDSRARRRRGEVRHRSLSQALPAQRARRHRPDHGQGRKDRALRREARPPVPGCIKWPPSGPHARVARVKPASCTDPVRALHRLRAD